jgi:hypothetical protein
VNENNIWINEQLKGCNVVLIEFADLSKIDVISRKGYKFGICIAMAIDPYIVSKIFPGPSLDYYNTYSELNKKLRTTSQNLAEKYKTVDLRHIL